MDVQDFILLMAALFTVSLPLVAIYSILGRIGWISEKGLMSDAFVIWITWLLSALTGLILIAILDIAVRFSRYGSEFLAIPAVVAHVVGSISVFFAVRNLSNPRIENIADYDAGSNQVRSNLSLRNVLLLSGGAAMALGVGIGVTILINAGYKYFFPPPENPFTIYDISVVTEQNVPGENTLDTFG